MEAKEGSFGLMLKNIKKIKYTIADGRVVVIHYENFVKKTCINMVFDAENQKLSKNKRKTAKLF